ncbi:restriction endonuclease subunit S [Enterococcus faecium]|uniref:restriction endonuclease subunit S n=1 Tax=Enterococcus faecium TaxID=1352 RepID=UPI00376FA056
MSNDTQPEIRFPGFTDDWEQRKFGVTNSYFTDGNYGESYPSADELSDKLNGVPFLRGSNLKNGRLVEEDANYITPEKHAELTSGHLELDDIVVAVRGSLGALGYAGQENVGWNINSQLAIIRTDKSELKGQFLIQYLLSSKGQKELLSRNTGTALKQLPIKQLKDVPVPIPGIDEQDRIGSFFVNLDTTIALHQRKLDLLKETKKGFLQKMFPKNGAKVPEIRFPGFTEDWEERKLGDMMDVTSVKRIHQSDWTNSGIRFLRARDIVSAAKNEEPSDYLYISEEKYNEYSKISGKVSQGDLLVTGVGSIGVPLLITDDNPIYFKDGNIIWFKNEHKIDGNFFYYSFINNKIQKYIRDVAGIGTVGTYTIDSGKKTPISLPTYDEQIKIGSFFKQLDHTIMLHQHELDLLKETKKGFLQKMFV